MSIEAFEIAKEKCLVFKDRAAKRAAELVLNESALGNGFAVDGAGVVKPRIGV